MQSPSLRSNRTATLALALAGSLALGACKTGPDQQTATAMLTSCLGGALVGALVQDLLARATDGKLTTSERNGRLAKAAVAGCAVGVAATAIGRMMDRQQQAKHEEAMQAEVRRRAKEQQDYVAATQQIESKRATTPRDLRAKDAELERARAAYQASVNRPVTVDLGNGGLSTIQLQPASVTPGVGTGAPATASPGASSTGGTCQEYSVLVRTPTGQARQFETWCPNSTGQLVRTDARDSAAA
jgi:hypothetical protein